MMFDLYRNKVIKILTDYKIADLGIELSDNSIYELEAKFTSYNYETRKFASGVPHVHYIRLIEILDKDINYTKIIQKSDVVLFENNIREITIDKIGGREVIYEEKTFVKNIDLTEYNVRISLNKEKTLNIQSGKPLGITRGRIRHSYISNNLPIQIDITEVTEEINMKIKINYEVEIEYYGKISDIRIFFDKIEEIFKLMKGTKNIYTNDLKASLDKEIGFLLKIKPERKIKLETKDFTRITSRSLVKARNIKYRDLVYGGIVGNKSVINDNVLVDKNKGGTDYYITYKADGVSKFFIIHRTGVWLVYPQEEYNLVITSTDELYSDFIRDFKDSVFHTELVIPKINENNSEYYVLVFDCLAFKGVTVENKSYTDRLTYCDSISNRLGDSIITLKLKEAVLLPEDPKLFFPLIKNFYEQRKTLNWKDDGFIFTPNNVIYNPRSQTINVKVRGRILYILDRDKEIKFTGSSKNILDYENVQFSDEFNNKVVEYSWTGAKFIPIKISTYAPDTKNYAIKIWEDITSPDVAPNKLLTTTPDVCKWKHPEDLTIDFKIFVRAENENFRRLELYVFDGENPVIFSGTDRFPLLPENVRMEGPNLTITEKLNNKIIEFEWTKEDNNIILRPRKYRPDKTNPNQKVVAEDVWEDIMDPIFIEDLTGETLELAIKYHNNIKGDLYFEVGTKYKRNFTLLDIGSGRGGDINRWKKFTGNIIAVEPYKVNRDELIDRINKNDMQNRVTVLPIGGEKTVEITRAVKKNIPGGKVDVVSLMLSMSFFWSSDKHLEALVRTIVTNLKPGGRIIFLTIDGDYVEEIFEPINGIKVDKMTISGANIHLYPSLGPHWGRPVDFELPGSIIEEGGQREYITHLKDFTRKLAKYGFIVEYISRAIKPDLLLSEQNLLYTSMYSYGSYVNIEDDKLKEFNDNIELPELPKVERVQNIALEPLEVIVSRQGPAINDDTYAPIKCTWLDDDIVRIATIGGKDSFIHSILKSFYSKYQNTNDSQFRIEIVTNVHNGLGIILNYENSDYPGYSYWQTVDNGFFPKMVMKEIADSELMTDHSLQGLITLLNSDKVLNKAIFQLIAEIFRINIYFIKITKEDIETVFDRIYKFGRKNIVISGNNLHFEPIAIDVNGLFQTVFDDNDKFIKGLESRYPEHKPEDENLDEIFAKDFVETFTKNGVFSFPEEIYDIFPDPEDPFRRSLDLSYDYIIQLSENY